MDRRSFVRSLPAIAVLAGSAPSPADEARAPIVLPRPEHEGGKSVLAALSERRTVRALREEGLPPQVLSNLLWAGFGVNRERGPFGTSGRTAPSASNSQEIDLYVALPEATYVYEPTSHRLVPVGAGDLRALVGNRGQQGLGATAPVRLAYVVDLARYAKAPFQEPGLRDPEIQKAYYYVATGLIAENVYLCAASQGLAAWFHNCDRQGLTAALQLRPDQRVLFGQTLGYPAEGFA